MLGSRRPNHDQRGQHDQRGRVARRWNVHRREAGGRVAAVIALLVLPAVLAACSDDAELDPGPSAPARLPPTTSAPASPAQDWELASVAPAASGIASDPAVQGYIAFRIAASEALDRLDRNYPPLLATSAGAQLEYSKSVIDRYVREGLQARGKARWSVVAAVSSGNARMDVGACEWDSAAWTVDRSGKIVEPVFDRWLPLITTMENVGGRWVATTSREENIVPCELAR